MVKVNKPAPVNEALKCPRFFWRTRNDIRVIPLHTRVFFIRNESSEINLGEYVSVKRIVDYVIASDYDAKVLEAAREAMLYVSPHKLAEDPFEQLGFEETPAPFFLGALFESLPEPIAVRLFWKRYALDKKKSAAEALDYAGQTLLRFSDVLKAAQFVLALRKMDPETTNEIVRAMLQSGPVRGYEFKRYEARRLLMELPSTIFPAVKAETRKARPVPVPKHFAVKHRRFSELSHQDFLDSISDFAAAIAGGEQASVLPVLQIVISGGYSPKLLAAARRAFLPITSYRRKEGEVPFKAFGFYGKSAPYFLGPLFELLPEAVAVKVFKAEILDMGNSYTATLKKAGRTLLRFSSAKAAAKFIRALRKSTDFDFNKFLSRCQRNYHVSGYRYRRYEVDAILLALGNLMA